MSKPRKAPQASAYEAPRGWQLWHHPDEGSDGWECLLYSDSNLLGSAVASLGPFAFFTTGVDAGAGDQPTGQLVLRIAHSEPVGDHQEWSVERASARRKWWLGLGPDEEVACLLSLRLGIRLRSGGLLRRFPHGADRAGVPEMHDHRAPALAPVPPRRAQLPGLRGSYEPLERGLGILRDYAGLQPTQAFVLAKAARHYADALWIADSDPEQAWLRLVTALETVAVHVQAEADPVDTFRESQPRATDLIEALDGGRVQLPAVAAEFARLLGAGRRVRAFVARYRPEPLPHRPQRTAWQVDWEQLDAAVKTIYAHRSALLHEGLALPPAMAGAFVERDDNGVFAECLSSNAVHASGSTAWLPGAAPMHLWVFAYLVRGALLNWCTEQVVLHGDGVSGDAVPGA
jgi:hypothetical protein